MFFKVNGLMILRLLILLTVLLAGSGQVAQAANGPASDWSDTDHAKVRLISATNGTGDQADLSLGLHFKMDKGWKVYWRTPGDAGFPPNLDWTITDNFKNATIHWPAPERFSVLGIDTLGYKKEVVFPLTATLKKPGQPFDATVNVDYLTCNEICIPFNVTLNLSLPAGDATPSPFVHLINQYRDRVPGDGARAGLTLDQIEFYKTEEDKGVLRLTATALNDFESPDLFIEGPDLLEFRPPLVTLTGTTAQLDVPVVGLKDLKEDFVGQTIVATLVDGPRSAEKSFQVVRGQGAPPVVGTQQQPPSMLWVIGLALLGGLILNLMPCVLPVLSIKVLGVIEQGGRQDKTPVRLGFLATSAGIITTFIIMAAALIGLKAAGSAVGWGIQFQHPAFLIALTVIVVLFACNLWGFFEFRLPGFLGGLAGSGTKETGLTKHFLTGIFATILATPCSAPFLGTAVGFALSQGTTEILVIFISLGAGLALPYLVIAALPGLATALPKPGNWMIRLKQILGFALAATAVWLISVIAAQSGFDAAVMIGLLMVLLIATTWGVHKKPRLAKHGKATGLSIILLAFLPTFVTLTTPGTDNIQTDSPLWHPFDEAAITTHVAAGKTVFVDVTADWCITCQVNKKLVLGKEPIAGILASDRVIAMKADWTKPDDTIAAYLAKHGRYGIPFNIVYGPKAPAGVILSELLTKDDTLAAFKQASGDQALANR